MLRVPPWLLVTDLRLGGRFPYFSSMLKSFNIFQNYFLFDFPYFFLSSENVHYYMRCLGTAHCAWPENCVSLIRCGKYGTQIQSHFQSVLKPRLSTRTSAMPSWNECTAGGWNRCDPWRPPVVNTVTIHPLLRHFLWHRANQGDWSAWRPPIIPQIQVANSRSLFFPTTVSISPINILISQLLLKKS